MPLWHGHRLIAKILFANSPSASKTKGTSFHSSRTRKVFSSYAGATLSKPKLTGRRLGGGTRVAARFFRSRVHLPREGIAESPSRQLQSFTQRTSVAGKNSAARARRSRRCSLVDMASLGYYDDRGAPSSYRYGGGGGGYARQAADGAGTGTGTTSFHLFLFLATASLLGAASLYSRYESAVESLFDQVRVVVVLSPLLLLLAMQYWAAAAGGGRRSGLSSLLMAPLVGEHSGGGGWYDQRRDGSSPWGVALALALVLLLISYQSCFQDWWFPLVNRRR
uniref:Uncharacterized protein n=1 Tax=Oryza punctata TaxID=4537 RepID=A0A0E0K5U4_ORYPU